MAKEDTQFKEGNPGRPAGVQNKLTKTVKETVLAVFNKLQEDDNFSLEWFAKKYPRDYYAIAAKLIPAEMNIKAATRHTIRIVRQEGNEPIQDAADN